MSGASLLVLCGDARRREDFVQTLSAAGIAVVIGCSGTVRQVVEQFKAGQLTPADAPNVANKFGMGRGMGRGGGMGRRGNFNQP